MDLSIVLFFRLQDVKPPFSNGFLIGFLWLFSFADGFSYINPIKSHEQPSLNHYFPLVFLWVSHCKAMVNRKTRQWPWLMGQLSPRWCALDQTKPGSSRSGSGCSSVRGTAASNGSELKSWENHGIILGLSWENGGKNQKKIWGYSGNRMRYNGKSGELIGVSWDWPTIFGGL